MQNLQLSQVFNKSHSSPLLLTGEGWVCLSLRLHTASVDIQEWTVHLFPFKGAGTFIYLGTKINKTLLTVFCPALVLENSHL